MALVIFCVALVAAMRTRMSLRLAISSSASVPSCPALCRASTSSFVAHVKDVDGRDKPGHDDQQSREGLGEFVDRGLELACGGVIEVPAVADGVEDAGILAAYRYQQALLEGLHPVDRDRIEVAVDPGIDDDDLLLHLERRELRLLEQLGQPGAAVEQALRGGVEVGAELREGRHFTILRQLALDAAGDFLHRLGLCCEAHARHREADVHRRADALIEQVSLQEDLAVGDRDDVGRDVGRHVVRLGLDHRQRGQRAGLVGVVHLGGALEQPRVQVEHVAGIGLAARRPPQQQRHLAIGDRLLGEIIVDDHGVHAIVAEVFAHGAAGKRRQVLHRRRIGGGGSDDDRVVERAVLLQHLLELDHGRALLPDRDVDAVELDLLVVAGVERLLVRDGVERDRGLAGLAIADDQLALAAADRDQRVDRLQARGHRLVHRLARDDAGRLDVDAAALARLDRAAAVERIAERVDHAAEQALADRHVYDGAGALDGLAFLDLAVVAEDHDADVVDLEIERHAAHAVRELDHLAGLHVVEAVDARDAVADRKHLADFRDLGFLAEILDLLLEDRGDFCGADVHQPTSFIACLIELSLVLSEASTMRLPTLTTSPPMIAGSTVTSSATSLPVTALSASLSASRCLSASRSATVTCAVTSPLWRATSARNARIMSRSANRRRFTVTSRRKLAAMPVIPARSSTAASALPCSSAPNTGLRTRRMRSGLSAISCSNRSRSAVT